MRIFIIDDDESSIFLTQAMLELESVASEVHTFLSCVKALSALVTGGSNNVPDVILLDLNMPVMNGWEFLSVLEQLDPRLHESCRIFVLTSSLDTLDSERTRAFPIVSDIFHKPINGENIKYALAGAFNKINA